MLINKMLNFEVDTIGEDFVLMTVDGNEDYTVEFEKIEQKIKVVKNSMASTKYHSSLLSGDMMEIMFQMKDKKESLAMLYLSKYRR